MSELWESKIEELEVTKCVSCDGRGAFYDPPSGKRIGRFLQGIFGSGMPCPNCNGKKFFVTNKKTGTVWEIGKIHYSRRQRW